MEIDEYWGIDNPGKIDENQDFVLALLQGCEQFGRGFTEIKKTGLPPHIGGVTPVNPEHDMRVAKFHVFCMRTLIDAWIESGRDGEVENPLKRHLSEPLMNALIRWSSDHRTELSFKRWTGEPSLYIPACRDANTECPFRNAWDDAIRLFAQLLDSPYRYRIAKCRFKGCTYYYTNRVPKGPLHYGTFCPAHRQRASASRAEYRKRNAIHEDRIKIAHGLWATWPPECRTEKSQRVWLASQIGRKQSKASDPVKINWVTRHLSEIVTGIPIVTRNANQQPTNRAERN